MSIALLDGPYDWPSEYIELKRIDSLLRCSICLEFFNIALISPSCSHNFCSYCIRKHSIQKKSCPTCNLPLLTDDLKCNRVLDELISYFKPVRNRLIQLLVELVKTKEENSQVKNPSKKEVFDEEAEFTALPSFRSPKSILNKSKNLEPSKKSKSVELSTCPVCRRDVPIQGMNLHLDQCLKTGNPIEEPQAGQSSKEEIKKTNLNRLKSLPMICFDALKDAELKTKAQKFGLPSFGDRKLLINRIKHYILLNNSQCDSLNPMSAKLIAKQVCREEKNLVRNGYTPGILIHTHDNRYTDAEKEKFNEQYSKNNEKHYQQIIKEIKSRINEDIERTDNSTVNQNDHLVVGNSTNTTNDRVEEDPSNEVIEIVSTPDSQEQPHGADKENAGIGHVPQWFDSDLVEANKKEQTTAIERTVDQTDKTKRDSKKGKKKKKKPPVKSANITSFFKNKAGGSKETTSVKSKKIKTKTNGNTSSFLLSDDELSIQPSPCLVQDTDDEHEMGEDAEDEAPPGNISSILESASDEDDDDELNSPAMVVDNQNDIINSSPLDSVCSSPSMIGPDDEEIYMPSVAGKRGVTSEVSERLNSTIGMRKENRRRCDIFLSPVQPTKKRCPQRSILSRKEDLKDTTAPQQNSSANLNTSGLSETIGKLVDNACHSAGNVQSDTDDECDDSEEFEFPSSILPMSTKKLEQVKQNDRTSRNVGSIPLPPCNDSFEFEG